jgi:hypothetical protein
VPGHDAFNRSFNRLTPATLKTANDLVVQAAVKLGLEDGSAATNRMASFAYAIFPGIASP